MLQSVHNFNFKYIYKNGASKLSFLKKENLSFLSNFLMFCGLKSQIFFKLSRGFFFIFNNIIVDNAYSSDFLKKFSYSSVFLSFLAINFNVYNIHFLLNWCVDFLTPMFGVSCVNVPKKFRKKLKKKYLYNIKYITKHKRERILFKWISELVYDQKFRKIENKFLYSFLSVFLNYKNNYIYKKKIFIYKWVLKNKIVVI